MESANTDPVADSLFRMVPPKEGMVIEYTAIPQPPEVPTEDDDFAFAREKLRDAVETGTDSLVELTQIATQSQHPRAFEVLANMISTITHASEILMNVNVKHKMAKRERAQSQNPTPSASAGDVINNNLFVGSTEDIQDIIKSLGKK